MGTEASFPSQSGGGWLLLPGSCRQRCAISGGGGQPHLQPLQPLQPLTGVPVGSPSHLPNNAIQGWLLTPDHSYLHAFVSSLLLSKNTILLTTQGGPPLGSPPRPLWAACRPSELSPPLIFTWMCASCGCTLITQPDRMFPEGTNSLPSCTAPLCQTQYRTRQPIGPQK